jgi:hypothetical protein
VWADSTHTGPFLFFSDRPDQFKVRAAGGVRIVAQSAGLNPPGLQVESTTSGGVAIFATQNSTDATLVVTNTGTGDLIRAFGTVSAGNLRFRVEQDGDVRTDGRYYCGQSSSCFNTGSGADLAERIDGTGRLEPGDVVEVDPSRAGHFRLAQTPASTLVAGVVSGQPAITMNNNDLLDNDSGRRTDLRPLLALVGQVPVKASAENGPIRIGDLLVASSTPGHAMKAAALPRPGTILGKALEPLEHGRGVIRMLVTLQ